jgi:hypothetical protein
MKPLAYQKRQFADNFLFSFSYGLFLCVSVWSLDFTFKSKTFGKVYVLDRRCWILRKILALMQRQLESPALHSCNYVRASSNLQLAVGDSRIMVSARKQTDIARAIYIIITSCSGRVSIWTSIGRRTSVENRYRSVTTISTLAKKHLYVFSYVHMNYSFSVPGSLYSLRRKKKGLAIALLRSQTNWLVRI